MEIKTLDKNETCGDFGGSFGAAKAQERSGPLRSITTSRFVSKMVAPRGHFGTRRNPKVDQTSAVGAQIGTLGVNISLQKGFRNKKKNNVQNKSET